MFTGIVKQVCSVTDLVSAEKSLSFQIDMGHDLISGLQIGASVAVDGVCLTVVKIEGTKAWFDAIEETLNRTSFKTLAKGNRVNVERSARFGDEIGGHILSGHVYGTAEICEMTHSGIQCILTLRCPQEWTKYLFPKGFIALNGASLTLVDVKSESNGFGSFTVHLIPETLRNTTFGSKSIGDPVNVELEAQTQAIVDTIERLLKQKYRVADGLDSAWQHIASPTARQTGPWDAATDQKQS